jgi:putative peptide zinc metalloprotease protein
MIVARSEPRVDDPVSDQHCPGLAPDVELCGRSAVSGFTAPQWLIRDGDRFLQVSELLYRVAEQLDGRKTYGHVAARLTATTEWEVSAEAARTIVQTRLRSLGLLDAVDGRGSRPRRPLGPPLLARARLKVIGARHLDQPSELLKVMYLPVVLVATLTAAVLAHVWMYFEQDMLGAARGVLLNPASLLAVLLLVVLGGAFHELGHAAALRYAGGRARSMGIGLFVIFPIFYTDVTDAYRFGRKARLRTDLGGIYFHLLFTTLLISVYLISGASLLLVAVALINLDTLRQLIPFIRLDGYWAVCDLTGVPDLNQQAGMYLRRFRRRRGDAADAVAAPTLRKGAATIALIYVAVAVPLLAAAAVMIAVRFPVLAEGTWRSLQIQVTGIALAWDQHDFLAVVASIAQLIILMLPLIGLAAMAFVLATVFWAPVQRTMRRAARLPAP